MYKPTSSKSCVAADNYLKVISHSTLCDFKPIFNNTLTIVYDKGSLYPSSSPDILFISF
jgi:hypothetical protein